MAFSSVLVEGDDVASLLAAFESRFDGGDARHDLGVVYIGDRIADRAGELLDGLRRITGVERWVGGVGIGVLGREGIAFDRPAISVLLAELPEDGFHVFAPQRGEPAASVAAWSAAHDAPIALAHADPRDPDVAARVGGWMRDGGPFLVGGLLSSRGEYAHIADGLVRGALSGVVFDGRTEAVTRITQGCAPIGPRRTVTRADGRRLYELDGRPALEALAEDLAGEAVGRGAANVHVALPLAASDTGDYLVRNLLGIEGEDGPLIVGEWLENGAPLMFCRRDADSARADLARMLDEISAALAGAPRAGLYVSCLARGPNLFAPPDLEVAMIRERLGDFPLAGFFANGEISCDRLYGYTGVLTLLR